MKRMILKAAVLGTMVGFALLFSFAIKGNYGEAAEGAKDFYKGKIIKLVVSARPGGGTDLAARVIAPFLAKYTGAKNVVIENNAKAGGLVAKNFVFNKARPDGLTIGLDPGSIPFQNYLTDAPGVQFDLLRAPWIGNLAPQPWMGLVGAKSPYRSIEDLKSKKGLKFGGATAGGGISVSSALVLYLFNLDGKLVTGFKGTTGVALALARGELDGGSGQTSNVMNNVRQGYVRPIVILEYHRVKEFPEVPAVPELIELKGERKQIFDAHLIVPTTKMLSVPPGTPLDRVQFLQHAMEQIRKDQEFKSKIEKAMGIECKWISIEETERLAKQATEEKKRGTFKKLAEIVKSYRRR